MTREILVYIEDMLDSIDLIVKYTGNLSMKQFEEDTLIQDAVCRRLEIIGESAKNIPADMREKFSDIPWRDIAGLRDVISHAYFNVVVSRIWNVIENDLPELKEKVSKVKIVMAGK